MTHRRAHLWLAVALGAAAIEFSASAVAQPMSDVVVDPPTPEERRQAEELPECESECEPDCNCLQGIEVTEYKNVILLNFGSVLAGRIELEYERALHRRVSIFTAGYVVAFDSVLGKRLVGYGWLLGARVYAIGGAPEGLWVAWELGQLYRNARGNRDVKVSAFQTGGMLGWTGIWSRFALTVGAGAQYTVGRVLVADASTKEGEWWPWFKLGMGVAF